MLFSSAPHLLQEEKRNSPSGDKKSIWSVHFLQTWHLCLDEFDLSSRMDITYEITFIIVSVLEYRERF